MPRRDHSRAALVEHAGVLFRRQGYAATGVHQILEAAGVKAGSLYHHFPGGKTELAATVVDGVGADVERVLRASLARDAPAADVLGGWIDALAAGLSKDRRDGCPIEPMATEAVHASPQLRAAAARAFGGWCAAIAERLGDDGWSTDDATQTAQALVALIEGALMLSRTAGDVVALDAAKLAARQLLRPRDSDVQADVQHPHRMRERSDG